MTKQGKQKIGFLGLGKMGSAIALALLHSHDYAEILAFDPNINAASHELPRTFERIHFTRDAKDLEAQSDIIIFCVKPQNMSQAVRSLAGSKQYISIMAGISVERLCSVMGINRSFFARVMPNLAVSIGHSPSAIYCEEKTLLQKTLALFSQIGPAFAIQSEDDMHAITALSGSGPALVASFLQACVDGAMELGLSHERSLALALQTMKGTVELIQEKAIEPSSLCKQVASRGGTTQAALEFLDENHFHTILKSAMKKSAKRSRELEASS